MPLSPTDAISGGTLSFEISPRLEHSELKALFVDAGTWDHVDLQRLLQRALFYVGAFDTTRRLVGFAKVVDDGGIHGFLLDPTVLTVYRRGGVGTALVSTCVAEAKKRGIEWLHVDFEPRLQAFYRRCGFAASSAGVMRLEREPSTPPVLHDR